MKILVPYVFLFLCIAIFYAHNEQLVHGLWNRYDTIFGGRLGRVFATEDALVNAHDFAGNASASVKAMTFSCAGYDDGAAIGNYPTSALKTKRLLLKISTLLFLL